MVSEQLLESFKKELDNLKDNDKFKINALTIFARDHRDSEKIAHGIVELTTKNVHSIPSTIKLLGLYVIDSIVKNVAVPFRKLYANTIVDAFVHSFQAIRDEKGRLKLYNLRTTWKDIFPNPRMYELDIRVREHDPAWPLLASPPEVKAAFRSLPSIPKIQPKSDSKCDQTTSSSASPTSNQVVISASRDPRLNRKRKSPTTPGNSENVEEFLIDRSGDRKMESVARKQGKQEAASSEQQHQNQNKSTSLFGGEDLDMRSQINLPNPNPSSPSPAKSGVWSNYLDKHSELGSRREVKDVDMRVQIMPDVSDITVSLSPPIAPVLPSLPLTVPSNPVNVTAPNSIALPQISMPLPPPPPQVSILNEPRFIDPRQPVMDPVLRPPIPSCQGFPSQPPLPPDFGYQVGRGQLMLPPTFEPPPRPPVRGPPIRGPVWNVEIPGFPDMVDIGVDPRMLSLVPHPKPPRRITIDGNRYTLLLDRVQPLVMIGNQVHAVRFRCECATILVNGRCFTIPCTGFTKVMIGWRPYQTYLGGPGHELIIDGTPHTVPLNSQLTYISVGLQSVEVKFVGNVPRNVNVLPPIPLRLLKWAAQGLFGSARHLHLAPLNPLVQMTRLAEGRPVAYTRNDGLNDIPHPIQDNQPVEIDKTHTTANEEQPSTISAVTCTAAVTTTTTTSTTAIPQPIDVHDLFRKLVQAGIVSDSAEKAPPEIINYNWDRFKLPCETETDGLYSGHQCSQCGLRFKSDLSPEFASHLDYHYMKNSTDQEGRSRNFYQASRYWLLSELTHDGAAQFEPTSPIPDLQECKCPAFADPSKNVCAVCFEKFDVFWDHEEEEWLLRDAVLVGDNVYHPICQEDAGKVFTEGNTIAHDMNEVKPPVSELSDDPTAPIITPVATTAAVAAKPEPEEEHAFVCDEQDVTPQIPGLSPTLSELSSPKPGADSPPSVTVEIPAVGLDTVDMKLEDDHSSSVTSESSSNLIPPLTKKETNQLLPTNEFISADPLGALKRVLFGDMSSLIKPTSSS